MTWFYAAWAATDLVLSIAAVGISIKGLQRGRDTV